ncbi:MAG TPA: LPS assembly protein LptD [Acidocella sp.]|uniref:LPS-assembly protein LptD n=1 Tax=Acidocella sp. TaxID=50710 RepID=UPI002B90C992|nr:LPS assembly protein LptD [Acidocella sp.]HVE20989.1 LPS assembly protein LptD [Acidocella sp.]
MNRTRTFLLGLATTTCLVGPAHAQLSLLGPSAHVDNRAPVSFTADKITYDHSGNIVTATGHVRAVQSGQTLYADKVVLNRTTNVAVATGHVILVQPDGNTVFADQATLSQGMKDAVMQGVSARLAMNARLIANGARRYNGQIDQLAKVVYSACDLCKTNPTAPPLWQLVASGVTRDLQHKMIEFHDARMEFNGFPVFYFPYLTEPDPSVRRQTGLLIPDIGVNSRLGTFVEIPYYFTLGPSADITLEPVFATKEGPALRFDYRQAFNFGQLTATGSVGRLGSTYGYSLFSTGTFDLNQDWRAGFNIQRASNANYLDAYSLYPVYAFLTSNVYLEGFTSSSYARLDADTYQGLVTSINNSNLPVVMPHGEYDFLSDQDALGGQYSVHADMFNVTRNVGTDTRRISAIPGYSVPFSLPGGVVGTARVELVTAAYDASHLFEQPNFSNLNNAETARAQPYGAVFMRLPLIRQAGRWGNQLIEPEVQFVASPNIGTSQNNRIPNEDSLDLEFSDANLFSLNRYPGIDRLEGGSRVDYAMHAAWYLPNGATLDGLLGQSYRFHKDNDYLPDSGLTDNVSDIVGRFIVAPTPYFNLTYRTRLSHDDLGARMIDATANAGTHLLNGSIGYFYENTNPYVLYNTPGNGGPPLTPPPAYFIPRHEITASVATNVGKWSFSTGVARNLQTGTFDDASFNLGWQNDCFGINLLYYQYFTSYFSQGGNGGTTAIVQFTFKTLGTFGMNAL